MIKLTFQSELDYIHFARTACIFTHLRAYNAGAHLWKKDDLPDIQKVDDKVFQKESPEEWRKCWETYKRAEKEYGEDQSYWRGIFDEYPADVLLRSLGFEYSGCDEDGDSYVASDLDINLAELKRNSDFPKSFPCVTCLEKGSKYDGPWIEHVYLADFDKPSINLDFGWLEENVRAFWKDGDGHYFGN